MYKKETTATYRCRKCGKVSKEGKCCGLDVTVFGEPITNGGESGGGSRGHAIKDVILSILHCFKHYADFGGRASRKEYWSFAIMSVVVLSLVGVLDLYFYDNIIVACILSFALLVPCLAVAVRRLHDIGKSGKWYLIILIPVVGSVWLLILMLKKGDEGRNNYGDVPML